MYQSTPEVCMRAKHEGWVISIHSLDTVNMSALYEYLPYLQELYNSKHIMDMHPTRITYNSTLYTLYSNHIATS